MVVCTGTVVRHQDPDEVGVDLERFPGVEGGPILEVVVDVTTCFKIESRGEAEGEAKSRKCVLEG